MTKLLYPAGAKLRVTREFFPWTAGAEVTLLDDWYEGNVGVTTQGDPYNMMIDADSVEPISEPGLRAQLDALLTLETIVGPDRDLAQCLLDRLAEYDKAHEA